MLCCKCGLSISFVEPMYSTEPCHRCITRAELPTPTADAAALTPAPQPADHIRSSAEIVAAERERIASFVERYPSPLNDLPMAMAIRDLAAAIRGGAE